MTDQLDLKKTYRAILDAARDQRFISYGDLANANDAEWNKVRYKMNLHLGQLVEFAVANDWPLLSAIVVNKKDTKNGDLKGKALKGFIDFAKKLDFDIGDQTSFVKQQQQEIFKWAQNAPDELEINEDETADQSAPSENSASDLFDDPNRQFWFVGANWDGDDQTERFISEGIWQNGHKDKFSELVARIKPGDLIAIKSTFKQINNLPFDNQNKVVSCMHIKAIGTVVEPTEDGKTIKVDWQLFDDPKTWYFSTGRYFYAISEAVASDDHARRLIQFAFGDHKQDYEFWLRQPRWAEQYRTVSTTPAYIADDQEEADTDSEEIEFEPYEISDILDDGCFLSEEALKSALSRLREKKNLILQGPPGTGKTWLAKRLGYLLVGTKDREITRKCMRSVQFHPSLSYEDFVRGWRPDGDGRLSLTDGIFLEAVKKAERAEPDSPFIIAIEEINRGNPVQIFGEMLTLLEKDKRKEGEAIELAYRRSETERIFIPNNLYVIGTMNIADRSLALVDFALRRRFAFVSLEPVFNETWLEWCVKQSGVDKEVLSRIQERMIKLNKEIAEDRTLGEQFKIGHSYVTPAPGEQVVDTQTWFTEIVETEIAPLLEEYWFENPDKAASSKNNLLQDL
ncbi:MAG: AAA family ATPase [Acidiferrobacterales bacterium]|nr:AAA family ATPase [Acidiferrobacterales bacterium]